MLYLQNINSILNNFIPLEDFLLILSTVTENVYTFRILIFF